MAKKFAKIFAKKLGGVGVWGWQFGFRLTTGLTAGGALRAARLPQTPQQAAGLQPPDFTAAGALLC